jgi:hypothetical protein
MNCNPGDLAIIVGTMGVPGVDGILGRVVAVVRIADITTDFGPRWEIAEPFVLQDHLIVSVADCILRPIRDPGDDAKDESFQWAPA